jgi:acetylcholinesterase
VFKRGKSTPLLGAFHSSDIPEFFGYGVNPDFIGTDALGMFSGLCMCWWFTIIIRRFYPVNFANTGNPTTPHNPNSLLSTVDWQPWSSSADHPLLTFLDPVPNVSITFDNFRVPGMNLLNNIFLHFASGSLDTGSMNEAITVNSDDKTDAMYILRSDEEL